jgi:hypothetical protein
MKKTVVFMTAGAAALGIFLYLLVAFLFRGSEASRSSSMPAVVDESIDDLLLSLETELRIHRPDMLASLQPGISDEKLLQAEATLGHSIHPEMQALYGWHNGFVNGDELFPGHSFWPLEEAIRTNREINAQYREKGFSLLMAHEEHWLTLFPDSAGDGYYYDPVKAYESGGIFYNFREAGYYRYFPSIRNLLKAILVCYQQGAYLKNGETNFELEEQIMERYGMAVEQK